MLVSAVQAVLQHRLRRQPAAGRRVVQVGVPADQVDRDVPPPVRDRERGRPVVGVIPAGDALQAAEAVFLEQRQQPVLDGEPGRVVSGVADRVAQGAPGALEEIPVPFGGVLDGADADDVVVRRAGPGDVLAFGDADQHVGGQQAADGADGGEHLAAGGGGHQ